MTSPIPKPVLAVLKSIWERRLPVDNLEQEFNITYAALRALARRHGWVRPGRPVTNASNMIRAMIAQGLSKKEIRAHGFNSKLIWEVWEATVNGRKPKAPDSADRKRSESSYPRTEAPPRVTDYSRAVRAWGKHKEHSCSSGGPSPHSDEDFVSVWDTPPQTTAQGRRGGFVSSGKKPKGDRGVPADASMQREHHSGDVRSDRDPLQEAKEKGEC